MEKNTYMDFVEEYASLYLSENAPANAVGSAPGNVAGLHGDPPVRRKKYRGVDIFDVDDDIMKNIKLRKKNNLLDGIHDKVLKNQIKDYMENNPNHPIIFSDKTGVMFFITK